jgi:hypothetical protein
LWLGGFLHGSGLILLHEPRFWRTLNSWLTELPREKFLQFLPLLRKAFSTINPGERRRLLNRTRSGSGSENLLPDDPLPTRAAAPVPGEWERACRPAAVLDLILAQPQPAPRK